MTSSIAGHFHQIDSLKFVDFFITSQIFGPVSSFINQSLVTKVKESTKVLTNYMIQSHQPQKL